MIGLSISLNNSNGLLPAPITSPVTPMPEVFLAAGDIAEIVGEDEFELTITGNPNYDGVYSIQSADLSDGPINLVPPQLSGDADPAPGEALTILPGLWIYDSANPPPVISYVTDGTGSVSYPDYIIQPGDAGQAITVTEEVTDPYGTRTQTSNPVNVGATLSSPTILTNVDFSAAQTSGGIISQVAATAGLDVVPFSGNTLLTGGAAVFNGTNTLQIDTAIPLATVNVLPATSYSVTNTGLDRITGGTYAGHWLIGNDGRNNIGSPFSGDQGLFILSDDFSIPVANLDVGATNSVQGVAFDPTDNTFWFADYGDNAIKKCDQTGVVVQSISLGYTPNGLAYIPETNELVITGAGREVRDAADGTLIRTLYSADLPTTDMLHWNSQFSLMFETYGSNGSQGGVICYPLDVSVSADRTTTSHHQLIISGNQITAIEGIYVDGDTGKIYVSDDSKTHAVGDSINSILVFDISDKLSTPMISSKLHVNMTGSFGPHTGDTDLMVGSKGNVLQNKEQSWGLYRISGGGFRFFSGNNSTGGNFYIDWPNVTTAITEIDFTMDVSTGVHTLRIDGVAQTPVTANSTTLATSWGHSFRLDDLALGATIALSNGQVQRNISNMTVATLKVDTLTS